MSGMAAQLVGNDLFQRFTADGTWKKPAGIKMVCIEAIGGGGSGAGGSGYKREGGSAGGGGALARKSFPAESLADTLIIDVGAGGAAPSPQGHGVFGAVTTVTNSGAIIISAYGGGGGSQGTSNDQTMIGGAGGGTGSVGVGNTGSSITSGTNSGGAPYLATATAGEDRLAGGGGGGRAAGIGYMAEFGGAGGNGEVRVWCW